jgi:hypothetical protein
MSTWAPPRTPVALAAHRHHEPGETIEMRGCDLVDLSDDGLIRRKDSYWNIRV